MQLINIKQLKGFYNTFKDSVSAVVPIVSIDNCEEGIEIYDSGDSTFVTATILPLSLDQTGVWSKNNNIITITAAPTLEFPDGIDIEAITTGTTILTFTPTIGSPVNCTITVVEA